MLLGHMYKDLQQTDLYFSVSDACRPPRLFFLQTLCQLPLQLPWHLSIPAVVVAQHWSILWPSQKLENLLLAATPFTLSVGTSKPAPIFNNSCSDIVVSQSPDLCVSCYAQGQIFPSVC